MPPDLDRLVALGRFGAAQGVRGEVRVKAYTADPRSIGAYGALTDRAGARRFALKIVRPLRDDMVVARVEGVATRDEAEALNGVELYARRRQLPPPEPDEFYHEDLVGLEAVGADGASLGQVAAIVNYGAGDILEIAPAGGGETILALFTKHVAVEIDFERGRIVIALPNEIDAREAEGAG